MPPIFGILHTGLKQPDQEIVRRMNGTAQYVISRKVESVNVSGGYMATAVVAENSLNPGCNTMAEKGEWVVVADVSLYKREELRKKIGRGEGRMGRKGEGEKGGDAELILEAWLKRGEDCVQHLYGDYAFVVFNRQTGEICCGRDPLGVRPLFYTLLDQQFIFGSELRYITAAMPHTPVIREDYLHDTLITAKTEKDLTPFEGVYRLKPGHFLRNSGREVNIKEYWTANPGKSIRFSKEEDYVQLLHERLVSAVKYRCEGVKVLGSELSGGLDSSTVCGIAATFPGQDKTAFAAFSNVFPAGTAIEFKDEREYIEAMLEFCPMNQESVDRLNLTIPELLMHSLQIQGCFIQQNYSIFNQGIYEAAGKKKVEVLLSGFGGDELVSARTAMPWNELIHERQWQVIADELYYKGLTPKSLLKPALLGARYLKSLVCRPEFKTGVFTPKLLDKRFASLPLRQEFAAKGRLRQRLGEKYRHPWHDVLAQRQYTRIMQEHLPQRLEYCYSAAAQYGMEYRYPLLDVDLIETCLAFPPWVKQHHGTNRYIFRQTIKGFVPEQIRQRDDKSGATIPQTFYSLVNEREAIMDLINSCSGSAYLNEIFDFSRFPEWYERLVKRDKKDLNYLMPGAFYEYLMILIYFRDKGQGTRDKGQEIVMSYE